MAIKSYWKNLVETTRARVDPLEDSRTAVFGKGSYDGSLRNYFF
jgi:hypothetical protein